MHAIILDIADSTPSLNQSQRLHWAKRHQLRVKWGWLVKAARLDAKVFVSQPLHKAHLTIERWGPRLLDHDNLVGGAKILQDLLVREGLIEDDKPACIGQPQYVQHIGPRRTVVRIEEHA